MKFYSFGAMYIRSQAHGNGNLKSALWTERVADIAQGTGDNQRVGRNALLHYVDIRLVHRWLKQASGDDLIESPGKMYEISLIADYNSPTLWSVTDTAIWEGPDATLVAGDGMGPDEIGAYQNRTNEDRFHILWSKVFTMRPMPPWSQNTITTDISGQDIQFYTTRVPINKIVSYRTGTDDPANMKLFLWVKFYDVEDDAGDSETVFNITTRVAFDDAASIYEPVGISTELR